MDGATSAAHGQEGDPHRRLAAHLYGLIVSGAVLATAPDEFRLSRVAVLLLITLAIYWAAETYAHLMAARAVVQRDLTRAESRTIVSDGWPLVSASAVPLVFLAAEALLGIETSVALKLTLGVNAILLVIAGWRIGADGGLRGFRLALSAVIAGLLGVSLVALKALMH